MVFDRFQRFHANITQISRKNRGFKAYNPKGFIGKNKWVVIRTAFFIAFIPNFGHKKKPIEGNDFINLIMAIIKLFFTLTDLIKNL